AAEQNNGTASYGLTVLDNKPLKGKAVEVIVQADGLQDAYAFEVALTYDAGKLKWLEAKTEVPGFTVKPIVEEGRVKLAHTLIGKIDGISGSRELFKIRFEAIQGGRAEIVLQEVRVVDSKLASRTEQVGA